MESIELVAPALRILAEWRREAGAEYDRGGGNAAAEQALQDCQAQCVAVLTRLPGGKSSLQPGYYDPFNINDIGQAVEEPGHAALSQVAQAALLRYRPLLILAANIDAEAWGEESLALQERSLLINKGGK